MGKQEKERFTSFEEFWPYYVAEHSQSATRALHAAGTTASIACALALISKGKWKFLPLALVGTAVVGLTVPPPETTAKVTGTFATGLLN